MAHRIQNIPKILTVIFLCVLYFTDLSKSEIVFDSESLIPQTSYFDVLNDHSNMLKYIKNEQFANTMQNVSEDVFHLFHDVINLVFNKKRAVYLLDTIRKKQLVNSAKEKQDFSNSIKKDYFIDIPSDVSESLKRLMTLEDNQKYLPSTCMNDTGRILTGLLNKEPWAVQFFDAMGKPGPSITEIRVNFPGNYDQCRAAVAEPRLEDKWRKDGGSFKGQYGTMVAKIRTLPIEIKLGTCLPNTCSDREITILIYQLFGLQKKLSLQYAYYYSLTGETEMTKAAIAAIFILSIIGFFMVIGTLFELFVIERPKLTKPKSTLVTNMNSVDISNNDNNVLKQTEFDGHSSALSNGEKTPLLPTSNPNKEEKVTSPEKSQSIIVQILLSFSVYSNGKKLLNTKQPPGSLGSIHGIRFFSMSWVVLCHLFAFSSSYSVNYVSEYPKFLKRWSFLPISNGFASVDTFFTLSGLLTSYLTIKEMMRRNTWKINWPLFYFHRFWRLTPPYMFAMVIALGLVQFMGQGALWSPMQPGDRKNCEENWWTNLLYINNLVHFDKECFGHSWYLANDMQFFVLSPLMLVPFFFHGLAGFLTCGVFLLTTWITTGSLSHHYQWPPTTTTLIHEGKGDWMKDYYVVPWCRIGPFVVGIMAGYILAKTNGRQFRMPWWLVTSGWIVSLATGLAVVYGLYGDITGENPSSMGAAAFYNAVNRSAWGACVSWVIIACSAGYGGPINTLLSWSPFVVLGRLTYMSYLIHINILNTFFGNLDTMFSFNDTTVVIYFLGLLLFVNMAAFVFVLALESPMLGLEKTFIKKGK